MTAARATQSGRYRPGAQSRQGTAQRRHAPGPSGCSHAGTQQGPIRRARALLPGIREAQRVPRGRSGQVGHELRPTRDRRPLGVGGQRASIATYPVALFDDARGPADRIEALRRPYPEEQPTDPAQGVLVADDVRHQLVLRPQPLNRYLIDSRTHLTQESRRVDRHLRSARPAREPSAGEQLAARPRPRSPGSV